MGCVRQRDSKTVRTAVVGVLTNNHGCWWWGHHASGTDMGVGQNEKYGII